MCFVQLVLNNPEIQHKIASEIPPLQAFAGFRKIKEGGRRLSNAEVCVGVGVPRTCAGVNV